MERITVEGITIGDTVPFPATASEVIAYALDEAGLIGADTMVNRIPVRELLNEFFSKRERFRENSRLGQLMVNEFGISRDQLVQALGYHELNRVPLGVAFIELGICDRKTIDQALGRQISLRKNLL